MGEGFRPNIEQPGSETPVPEQNPEGLESVLSPEVVEAIMGKVQDIDKKGTAYTGISRSEPIYGMPHRLGEILKYGLLGVDHHYSSGKTPYEYWQRDGAMTGTMKGSFINFNIVGRIREKISPDKTQIAQTDYSGGKLNDGSRTDIISPAISIIFDLSSYKEQPAPRDFFAGPQSSRKYHAVKHKSAEQPSLESGFALSYRIAPRKFRGIVLSCPLNQIDENSSLLDSVRLQMEEVNKTKPEFLVPIYDINGNLLYPKQMSYDEVKKFVAERDAEKGRTP
ncbi:MAG: hypothetical protein Q7S57_00130 [bacterium]|nr:hypothetical protein [bacterium]